MCTTWVISVFFYVSRAYDFCTPTLVENMPHPCFFDGSKLFGLDQRFWTLVSMLENGHFCFLVLISCFLKSIFQERLMQNLLKNATKEITHSNAAVHESWFGTGSDWSQLSIHSFLTSSGILLKFFYKSRIF